VAASESHAVALKGRAAEREREFETPLRYVGDEPGLRRLRRGRGFSYLRPEGGRVADRASLARIRALAIPPAWTSVWICSDGRGHIQATGRDARGRKQYRYHPVWSARRGERKFDQLVEFGEMLPRLRRRLRAALGEPELSRERVLAAMILLLDSTLVRVGNREYQRANGSFGLTTLLNRHARREQGDLRLVFRGKSGVQHSVKVDDPRVARVVQRCQALPGQALFQYVDEAGELQAIRSDDLNDWLRERADAAVTAKQFRTWHASALALEALLALEAPAGPTAARDAFLGVVDEVATRLGNTRAVCRSHYLHPDLETEFVAGRLTAPLSAEGRRTPGLARREVRLLAWLQDPARRSSPAVPEPPQAERQLRAAGRA
jgi:DNA topoisomerase I